MKNEYRDTQKIRQALEQGSQGIDSPVATRLAQARNQALDHQKVAIAELRLASGIAHISHALLPRARLLMALAGLSLGVMGTYYWNAFEQAEENEEVDSALLADDLPVAAYTDQGFQAWLEHTSQ